MHIIQDIRKIVCNFFLQCIPRKHKIGVRQKSEIIQLITGRLLRQRYG